MILLNPAGCVSHVCLRVLDPGGTGETSITGRLFGAEGTGTGACTATTL